MVIGHWVLQLNEGSRVVLLRCNTPVFRNRSPVGDTESGSRYGVMSNLIKLSYFFILLCVNNANIAENLKFAI